MKCFGFGAGHDEVHTCVSPLRVWGSALDDSTPVCHRIIQEGVY